MQLLNIFCSIFPLCVIEKYTQNDSFLTYSARINTGICLIVKVVFKFCVLSVFSGGVNFSYCNCVCRLCHKRICYVNLF